MKEYINKTTGEYRKTSDVVSGEQWVEIPKGADLYGRNKLSGVKEFYKRIQDSHGLATLNPDGVWIKSRYHVGNIDYLWHRATQPEALPFVDDESSLDAEIENVRQAIKVKSGSNSDHTEDAMSYGFIGLVKERENNHYFKDVSDIDTIDVYEVLKRFNVTDPCLQHLIKKALCVGNRGHKDLETDLRDILKSAKRALEINGFSL